MAKRRVATLVVALWALHAHAQGAAQTQPVEKVAAPASLACCTLVAGTPVDLELQDPLSSGTAKRGDRFTIVLKTPLTIDGTLVVPVGTTGEGEVVHAERARGGGKPGELLLAARYLELGGTRIPLRGMKLGARGTDRTGTALGASFALGPFAQFIRGGEIELPKGTAANAKLAEALVAPAPVIAPESTTAPAPSSSTATPVSTTTEVSKE